MLFHWSIVKSQVDQYNINRRAGTSPIDAASAASARRFRPVLLTTLSIALGLGPLLTETSPQAFLVNLHSFEYMLISM